MLREPRLLQCRRCGPIVIVITKPTVGIGSVSTYRAMRNPNGATHCGRISLPRARQSSMLPTSGWRRSWRYTTSNSSIACGARTRSGSRPATCKIPASRWWCRTALRRQGNGTQEIFWDRDDVLYASVHVDPGAGWYPHFVGYADEIGEGIGTGATLNVPMPAGTRDDQWLEALVTIAAAVRAHGSEAMVVSLGVDAAADDPNSPLQITSAWFREAGRLLGELRMPTVFVQEGGYDLGTFATLVCEVLHGFEERNG